MRVALAQINSTLGDFAGNQAKVLAQLEQAKKENCDLVVFPEAALFGYHPVDLLERLSVVELQEKALTEIHKKMPPGLSALVGAIVRNPKKKGKGYWNAAVLLRKGKKAKVFAKQLLPTYDVFDESRHIEPGQTRLNIFKLKGQKVLVTICEDIWAWPLKNKPWYSSYPENPLKAVKRSSVDLVVNLSASPFTTHKLDYRLSVTKSTAQYFRCPLIYVNMVGGQDELIFDGASFAINKKGEVLAQAKRFKEDFVCVDLKQKRALPESFHFKYPKKITADFTMEQLEAAICLGLKDFVHKTGFKRIHLGLSGGVDSALLACLAAKALGSSNVKALYLPGPFSATESGVWSKELAENLNIELMEVPIFESYETVLKQIEKSLGAKPFALMNENLQARLRGLILMAYANRESSLLLCTSNKSELAVGYTTLYGDMCGGLLPIGDLLKTEVYQLSRYINAKKVVIPEGIIERPPSAELRANQKDQDSLPPYSELDQAIRRLVVGFLPAESKVEERILDMMMKSEFKRWQAPPVLKISDHAFGRGRRFPLAHRAKG